MSGHNGSNANDNIMALIMTSLNDPGWRLWLPPASKELLLQRLTLCHLKFRNSLKNNKAANSHHEMVITNLNFYWMYSTVIVKNVYSQPVWPGDHGGGVLLSAQIFSCFFLFFIVFASHMPARVLSTQACSLATVELISVLLLPNL